MLDEAAYASPPPCGEGFGVGVVQKAPLRSIRDHPHLLPPPHKGEERRRILPTPRLWLR